MTDSEWDMAEGFAPVSRLDHCQHPRACSAPARGLCSRCQKPASWMKRARRNHNHPNRHYLTVDAGPSYVDEDFDSWGAQ